MNRYFSGSLKIVFVLGDTVHSDNKVKVECAVMLGEKILFETNQLMVPQHWGMAKIAEEILHWANHETADISGSGPIMYNAVSYDYGGESRFKVHTR